LNQLRDPAMAGNFLQQVLDILHGQGTTLLGKGGTGADDKITGNREADRNADQYVRSERSQIHNELRRSKLRGIEANSLRAKL
jgi:hypothetical protein